MPAIVTALMVTLAIPTYLDLKKVVGCGEEAAAAVYEKLLAGPLQNAAKRWQEVGHDEL